MKPIASPLNIIDFAILNFELHFIQPKKKNDVDINQLFTEYDIDIDFTIHGNDIIQVFLTADINKERNKRQGYSISAEVACIFEFNKAIEITAAAKKQIEGFSTIYIALNSLRGFISQFTASAPLGRYILPSIDLNDLIRKKQALAMDEKKTKAPKKITVKKQI